MKAHYHSGVETLVINAIGVALVFHAFRWVGFQVAKRQQGVVGKAGEALGGVFTFGGA